MKLTKVKNRLSKKIGMSDKIKALIGLSIAVLLIFSVFAASASADVFVNGYFRSNGTYVQPHYRSSPDSNFYNNWSTYPNINPYTGRRGTRRW